MNRIFMPAEWAPQWGIQLTWPHEGTDWQPYLDEITETYIEMARAITTYEHLLVVSPETEQVKIRLSRYLSEEQMSRISFLECPTNDTWARDHGFISLIEKEGHAGQLKERLHLLDFCFNGWGEKFEAELDNAINTQLFYMLSHDDNNIKDVVDYENHLDFVLEGGSIESDGEGTIFTTSCCLLAPHRNQPLEKAQIETELQKRLHAERIVWLDCTPMSGDDTDGHIDTIVRTAPHHTLLYNKETGAEKGTSIHEQLKNLRTTDGLPYRLLELPIPSPIYDDKGEQLPATYANFLILNGAVLVPIYQQQESDAEAIHLIQSAFPDRKMIPIDSRSIIRQHGSIHCCTMQFPLINTIIP